MLTIMTTDTRQAFSPFVRHLESLRDEDDRGALAVMRRGALNQHGRLAMARYVVPHVQQWERSDDYYYTIASLFAMHPVPGGQGNIGNHLADLVAQDEDRAEAIEKRFSAMLTAHPDDLGNHLRRVVSLLKSAEIPVNWHRLFGDMRFLQNPNGADEVRRQWSYAFWRNA
jgi:CRISPR system Cascade subunit CasB